MSSAFASAFPLLDDAAVASLVPMGDAIECLRRAFADEAAGIAATMQRTRILWNDGRLQAMGGYLASSGYAATKTWAVTPGGGQPVIVVFSLETGAVEALLESRYLSQLRTGATSGLATDLLAAADADACAIVGTGRQAFAQAEAVCAVRPIELVRVAGRDRARASQFADIIKEQLGVRAEVHTDVTAAVRDMPIVTLITSATEPIIHIEQLAAQAHVNGVGTILPSQAELADDVFGGAGLVAVDSVEQAVAEAGDLQHALATGSVQHSDLVALAELVAERPDRPSGTTVFKGVGAGIEDVAIAAAVANAHAASAGSAGVV